MFVVSASGNLADMNHLLLRGAEINQTNKEGLTPLYIAVLNGHDQVVDGLLSKKYSCNPNIPDFKYHQTPLHLAALVISY